METPTGSSGTVQNSTEQYRKFAGTVQNSTGIEVTVQNSTGSAQEQYRTVQEVQEQYRTVQELHTSSTKTDTVPSLGHLCKYCLRDD